MDAQFTLCGVEVPPPQKYSGYDEFQQVTVNQSPPGGPLPAPPGDHRQVVTGNAQTSPRAQARMKSGSCQVPSKAEVPGP